MGSWGPEKNLLLLLSSNSIISICLLYAHPYAHKYFYSSLLITDIFAESQSWSERGGKSYSGVLSSNCFIYNTIPQFRFRKHQERENRKILRAEGPQYLLADCLLQRMEKILPDISTICSPKQVGNDDSTNWLVNTNGDNLRNGYTPRTLGNYWKKREDTFPRHESANWLSNTKWSTHIKQHKNDSEGCLYVFKYMCICNSRN